MSKFAYDVRNVCSIRELIETSAEEFSSNPAFLVKDKNGEIVHITYARFMEEIKALSTYLCSKGLENKKIAVIGRNSYEWALSYMAIVCGTGIVVPIDKELKAPEVKNILDLSGSDAVIYAKEMEDKIDACEFGGFKMCKTELADAVAEGKKLMENGNESYDNHKIDVYGLGALLYTSGTTGVAKGVMLSQYNIASDVVGTLKTVEVTPSDRTLSVLPLHHTYECTLGLCAILYAGASICYASSLLRLLGEFKEYQPTVFMGVPQLLKAFHTGIMKKVSAVKGGKAFISVGKKITTLTNKFNPEVAPKIFKMVHEAFGGKLRMILVGAASVDKDIFLDLEKFGFRVYTGYGLTETAPLCVMHNDRERKADTIGLPLAGDKVKIVNPNSDGIGELAIKGPNVMIGYYNDEEATKAAFDDEGYFLTGDLAKIDPESGHYMIVGRIKNMIVTDNGKKIFPEEIEVLLEKCECIKECMAYGAVNDIDETIVAVKIFPNYDELEKIGISKDDPEIEEKMQNLFLEFVKTKVNKNLPGYKAVHKITIRHREFDKTTTQKIKRMSEDNLLDD
ncbi:MAG: AMP-binding protein [Oscillospiraceae bacterium]|nr:AMP-binding protein [Oscillospiraceae bacterium]